MVDNITVTPGTGKTVLADEVVDGTLGTGLVQMVKIMDGTLDGTTKAAVGANGLAVDVKALPALPTGSNVIGALTANQSVNVAQINGVTPLMGNGVTGTGSQRVTIASDNTAFAVNATLSAETTKVLGVTRTADGAGNLLTTNSTTYTAKFGLDGNLLGTLGTAFTTAGKVDVKGADGDVFVRQATAANLNATVVQATGTNLHTVVDSGTITTVSTVTAVTGITNALPAGTNIIGHVIDDASATAGGISTTARLASAAASTNATNVKTSAGRIYSLQGKNNATYDVFLVLYDAATNPPVPGTTTIRKKIVCPATQGFAYDFPLGLSFANGIGYAFTKLAADADTTVLVAADITVFNMDYV